MIRRNDIRKYCQCLNECCPNEHKLVPRVPSVAKQPKCPACGVRVQRCGYRTWLKLSSLEPKESSIISKCEEVLL